MSPFLQILEHFFQYVDIYPFFKKGFLKGTGCYFFVNKQLIYCIKSIDLLYNNNEYNFDLVGIFRLLSCPQTKKRRFCFYDGRYSTFVCLGDRIVSEIAFFFMQKMNTEGQHSKHNKKKKKKFLHKLLSILCFNHKEPRIQQCTFLLYCDFHLYQHLC